ncbi:T cell receptor beta chain MC.7.G5-like isoform X2 [Hemibagrus wyckioides]|uniref:T cell receptor beta chain MC.7.G5-like isoform X2 n=1 Tax=Hemibagrus wyckioides TaxID=337641 RepID=UPI00266DA907|nr:T cell receptor beta chain MC.7.G5-like isoform X2 [Hemibagrus wyckioides]
MCSYSQAYFGAGTKLTVLDKNVKISEPVVKVLDVSEKEACQKTNITLVCLAESFYPDHVDVIWTVDGDNRTTDVSTDEAAIQNDETKFYSISSRLNINYKNEWTKGKKFTCTVRFYNGKEYTENSHFITGPKIEGDEERTEKYVLSVNTTMLAYGMFIAKSIAYGTFILYIIKRQGFISK